MYAFQKGKKEILAKTKRGITQRYDSFSSHKLSQRKKDSDHLPVNEISNPAKPFFNNRPRKSVVQQNAKEISPEHQKMIKYINESWSNLMKDYENIKSESSSANISNQKIFYYKSQCASTPGKISAKITQFVFVNSSLLTWNHFGARDYTKISPDPPNR